jgi:demethylmenaquinone methyltransferase/2-methoxy-6-polyprenyl-1,4-benzoquinol methylase
MKAEKKGNAFRGLAGGANYEKLARCFGFGPKYYRRALGDISLAKGMRALDLGCGTGGLSFAMAEKDYPKATIIGIDISDDQINYARVQAKKYACSITFEKLSMDELPYPNNSFDIIVSSMAFHETPPKVRRAAISEVARLLRKGGRFILVDWSKPKFGLWGMLWLPTICFGQSTRDNWRNVYPQLCLNVGLEQVEDAYINSLARRQVFVAR